jgi:hypothetical protein
LFLAEGSLQAKDHASQVDWPGEARGDGGKDLSPNHLLSPYDVYPDIQVAELRNFYVKTLIHFEKR